MKRYGKKHSFIQEMVRKYKSYGYNPPFVLISHKPIGIKEFVDIAYNDIDKNCPKGICYLKQLK